jgi:uncharacterized repeat protein (TIGR01451 family)
MRQVAPRIVLVCVALLYSGAAVAQFAQQGPKLTGADAVPWSWQGYSVSLSADGNTAIAGGPNDSLFIGAAWVWTRSGGVWSQQGSKLTGSGAVRNASQGYSVSLSADGNTAIAGGPTDAPAPTNSSEGAAWVWARSGGVWSQQGTKLVTFAFGTAAQGCSVSLSADGNTAIIGGPGDNHFTGAAWIWTRSGGVWSLESKLVAAASAGAQQGVGVGLSADGNTAIVGGYHYNSGAGAAWIWTRTAGHWTQQGPRLAASDVVGNAAGQGFTVSLSADGNTALIGGPGDNNLVGAAWIWTRNAGVWTQQGAKLVGSSAVGNSAQGGSVSLSGDGNTAIVGGYGDNNGAGAAWIWTRSGGVWTQLGTKLVGSDAVGSTGQGSSVAMSGDGNTAIVGGIRDNNGAGAVWIFGPAADLSIVQSVAGGSAFIAGANLTFTMSVVNHGPVTASNVVVTDVLPAGTMLISATPSQGSCSGTNTLTCAVGALVNGGTTTINVILETAATAGTLSNTVTVAASQVDPNPADNSSTSIITTINSSSIPAASRWVLIALAGMLAVLGAVKIRA